MQDPRVEAWVEAKMAALEPSSSWKPDASQGLARFRQRQKSQRTRWIRMAGAGIAASVAGIGLFLAVPATCEGAGCAKPAARSSNAPVVERDAPPSPAPAPNRGPQAIAATAAYKASGSLLAPVTVEVYSDYECPHCATTSLEVIPEFTRDYVATGKARLIHRDYPLNQHQYARLAARYANAAGTLGHYDAVVQQLFRTQASWALSGDLGTQVAQVLPPGVMSQVRKLVDSDARLEDTVDADMAQGRLVPLTMTPTMVVTYKGKSQTLAPVPGYELLKSYLDELLTK
ncbi:MAG: thioredoxin domain-containing protein [Candidatus Solibacter sp.]